jgi:hypothetical protein
MSKRYSAAVAATLTGLLALFAIVAALTLFLVSRHRPGPTSSSRKVAHAEIRTKDNEGHENQKKKKKKKIDPVPDEPSANKPSLPFAPIPSPKKPTSRPSKKTKKSKKSTSRPSKKTKKSKKSKKNKKNKKNKKKTDPLRKEKEPPTNKPVVPSAPKPSPTRSPKTLSPVSSRGLFTRPLPATRTDVNDNSNNPSDEWMKMTDGDLVVWPRARLAGAIWSIRLKNKPLVPELVANGGSWQSACFFNVSSRSEEYNPTQAGSMTDVAGITSSKLKAVASDKPSKPTQLFTRTQMAYFFDPANTGRTTDSEGKSLTIKNKVKLSQVTLSQHLQLMGSRKLKTKVTYNVPATVSDRNDGKTQLTQGTFEFLAAYIDQMFQVFYTYHNKTLKRIPTSSGNVPLPCIFASQDGKYAIGVKLLGYAPKEKLFAPFVSFFQPRTDSVPIYDINGVRQHFDTPLAKFNLVSGSGHDHHMQGDYTFEYMTVFGTLQEVQKHL